MKKSTLVFLAVALSSIICCSSSKHNFLQNAAVNAPPANLACLTKNCAVQAGECMLSKECRSAITCAQKCMSMWDQDTTIEKVHVQNCTNICAFSYRGKAYEDFMECVGDHRCISFPPIPSRCKAPGNISLLKKLSSSDLLGEWWVVKGLHPVYDCYPCQHLFIERINATALSYTPKYQVYLANGSLGLSSDRYIFPNTTPGEEISFVYHDVGLSHYENWWLFDAAEDKSYILLYYCGNTLQWYYDGALVLARKTTLADSDYSKIAESYQKATGLELSHFCDTSTSHCPD